MTLRHSQRGVDRDATEADLATGLSLRATAEKHGVSKSALSRHERNGDSDRLDLALRAPT
jgi:hypothetical protein